MTANLACPGCANRSVELIYRALSVPVHDVILHHTRAEALGYPKGDIDLGFCPACGLIFNSRFDPDMMEYSDQYESTQAYSPTFNAFHERLADQLIRHFDLHNKKILEIGCGQGEFLSLLCVKGDNQGIGFDPAYLEDRHRPLAGERVTFIKDDYSERYSHYQADFYCCKMTLEHIAQPAEFVGMVRRAIGAQPNATVFFQVPDVKRILSETAFWDIFYEHCSYFSLESLSRLFHHCGFDVLDIWRDYDDQYLMLSAAPANGAGEFTADLGGDLRKLAQDVHHFQQNVLKAIQLWREQIAHFQREKKRAAIWGGGSKCVAFLNTLKVQDEIGCVVDINPLKEGTFLAGTGHRIVGPGFLSTYQPDVVILMNPIYSAEVRTQLEANQLFPELIPITYGLDQIVDHA